MWPVTVYVATGHIESGRPYWFDRVMNALQSTTECELRVDGMDAIRVGARSETRNWQSIARVLEALKALAPQDRERLSDKLIDAAAGLVRPAFTPLAPLSLPQLVELSRSRWVTLGAHTHDHALLDQVPLDGALASIRRSVDTLVGWTGRKVEHFAYPNGNYSQALAREVQAMGFRSAVTTVEGLWMPGQPLHEIARVPVGRFDDLAKFRLKLLGR
jgi:peptidoglycan/xylan/chitin deacetylase (PgdA/CDA1 family)